MLVNYESSYYIIWKYCELKFNMQQSLNFKDVNDKSGLRYEGYSKYSGWVTLIINQQMHLHKISH